MANSPRNACSRALSAFPAVCTRTPQVTREKRLEVFVGKWNVDGQARASPYAPAGKLTSVDTWAWMPGGFFMTHHWDSKQGKYTRAK